MECAQSGPSTIPLAQRLAIALAPPLSLCLASTGPLEWPGELLEFQKTGIVVLMEGPSGLRADGMGGGTSSQPAAAIRLLREAAMAGSGDAALSLATLLQSRDPGDALTWARRGSAALAMRAYAHRVHGAVALTAGALDEAAAAYARAYELEPRNPGGRCELGRLYERLGRIAEARPLLAGCKVP
jgi:TPR repeat protein